MNRYYLYQSKDSPECFYIQKGINITWVATKDKIVKYNLKTLAKRSPLMGMTQFGSIKDSQLEMYLTLNPEMTIGDLITILEA